MSNKFDLQRAIAGEPFETVGGEPAEFVAYRPTAREWAQLVVQIKMDLLTYHANGRYHRNPTLSCSFDLRMKSAPTKQIDWSKMPVDTLINIGIHTGKGNRYFHSFANGMVHYFRDGMTSKTAEYKSDVFTLNPSEVQIAPDQPWTVWQGGACPLPDGLEYEVVTRGGVAPLTNRGSYHVILWSYTQNATHSMSEIIAYRLTGKVLDGWTL
jgi:hypothetical protein